MKTVKNSRYAPRYKPYGKLKIILQNKTKVLKFKKLKWKKQKAQFSRLNLSGSRNSYYKFYDQYSYNIPKFTNKFSGSFKETVKLNKLFRLQYGYLGINYVKSLLQQAYSKSNASSDKLNVQYFFIELLERRLDVTLFRLNFAPSIRSARQLIFHGNVLVNGKKVDASSFLVKKGDKVTFEESVKDFIEYTLVKSSFWPLPPKYLQVNYKIFQVLVIDDIKYFNISNSCRAWFDWSSLIKEYN